MNPSMIKIFSAAAGSRGSNCSGYVVASLAFGPLWCPLPRPRRGRSVTMEESGRPTGASAAENRLIGGPPSDSWRSGDRVFRWRGGPGRGSHPVGLMRTQPTGSNTPRRRAGAAVRAVRFC